MKGRYTVIVKKNNKIRISFVDSVSSDDVTGSMVLITTPNNRILLDAGMHQTNDRYEDFLVNNRKYKEFKPKDLTYVFITHLHADHCLSLPRLYKMGFNGFSIISEGSGEVLKDMAYDAAEINERDVITINNQHNKSYSPIYGIEDVDYMLQNTVEFPVNKKIKLDDELSFELIPNGHLLGSVQVFLYITIGNVVKTILYTGDIGNKLVDNKFVGKYQQVEKADIVIGESTYGDRPELKTTPKERNNDLEKLKSIINTQVKEMKGRVVIPTFAQSRAQQLALFIYNLYKDSEWKPKVYMDSPLAIKIFDDYSRCLQDEEKELFFELLESNFIHFVKDPMDSKALVESNEPCVVLSTAGMCQVGRIRHHLKKVVPDPNSTILFVGYSSPNSLGAMLKDPKRKTISIDQKEYVCRCSVYNLKSLSGHAPYDQLVDDYASIKCQKIILHHGSKEAKECLKEGLEKELAKRCNSARVIIANPSLKFSL